MFRQMLLSSASRLLRSPKDDGGEDLEDELIEEEAEEVEDDLEDGDDPEPEGEEGDDPPEPRQPTRGENRVAAATRTAAEAKAKAEGLEREIAEMRRQRDNPTITPAEQQRLRAEHLATLTESQRTEFLIREQGQNTERQLAQIRFESYDATDKAAFAALAAKSPAIRALEADVEARLAEHRASGQNAPRENVLRWILGDKALAKATRANNAGDRRAATGRERQTVRPPSGRSDVAASRSRVSGSKLEDRLRDVKL